MIRKYSAKAKCSPALIMLAALIIALLASFSQEAQSQQAYRKPEASGQKVIDPPIFHYLLAYKYLSHADLELAALEIQQTIALKPAVKKPHAFYCLISFLRFNLGQALAELMMAVGLGQSIPLTAPEMSQLNAQCAKAHYRKGLSYEEQKNTGKAIYELKLADYYQPKVPRIMRSLAFNLGQGGKIAEAQKYYQDSFRLNTKETIDDAFAHADYAYLLAASLRQDEAMEQLNKAVAIAPDVAALHVDLSVLLEKQGKLAPATDQMQAAINTAPSYADLAQSSKLPLSQQSISSMILRRPPTYASLWADLGRLYDKQNKVSQARKAYAYALLLDGQNRRVITRLSELQRRPPIDYASSSVAVNAPGG